MNLNKQKITSLLIIIGLWIPMPAYGMKFVKNMGKLNKAYGAAKKLPSPKAFFPPVFKPNK